MSEREDTQRHRVGWVSVSGCSDKGWAVSLERDRAIIHSPLSLAASLSGVTHQQFSLPCSCFNEKLGSAAG